MYNYTKLQKTISFILIFFIFFSFTVNISIFDFYKTIFADEAKYYNLVSIFVDEDVYNDISSEINTYAKDIQGVLENTKTIIIPTNKNTSPYDISSLNEKLYLDGYNGLAGQNGDSKLIGSVFVGNISLPVVENNGDYEKTVLPYVDFVDKIYTFNFDKKIFELNQNNSEKKAEIWHGFISPNTGNKDLDIENLKTYFKKNHDFYTGQGDYKNEKNVTNGVLSQNLSSTYEPYVFYYDQLRELEGLKYVDYIGYKSYLENLEDLSYDRYSYQLAKKLSDDYISGQNSYIGNNGLFGTGFNVNSSGLNLESAPDIQLRHVINSSIKNFVGIFNSTSISDIRKNVHNAGRYNFPVDKVNVDLVPHIITGLDEFSKATIKNVNNDLENKIDNLVISGGISRNLAVPSTILSFLSGAEIARYDNFLYGNIASNISTAKDCSIYRGNTTNSGTLVEANRGYNVSNISGDISKCQTETSGYWGGNSPANLDISNLSSISSMSMLKLKDNQTKNAIENLFDINGSIKRTDNTKSPSPLNCLENNFILTKDENTVLPVNGNSAKNWSCSSQNVLYPFNKDFKDLYENIGQCEKLILDGATVKETPCSEFSVSNDYYFKKVPSYIIHKSPTSEELSSQTKDLKTPNLPIDKDRYIDFIGSNGDLQKINYPYLYRFKYNSGSISPGDVKKELKIFLDEKSKEINSTILNSSPEKATLTQKELYNLLKSGEFTGTGVDLYKFLSSKPDKTLTDSGDTKIINYLDTLSFALYWNNLPSVSAKYKFIFEYYLGDQFGGNDFNFFLPKNKKSYEVGYIGANGDSKNMYIKLDPEDKAENPYTSIIAKNQDLNNKLLEVKSNLSQKSGDFKCSPPDGVPLWQWFPAITCRLKDMLPPKVSINAGNCGYSLTQDDKNPSNSTQNQVDANKNSINDYIEKDILESNLLLKTNSTNFYYNKASYLEANLVDTSGKVLPYYVGKVDFDLQSVSAINPDNSESLIYDKQTANTQENFSKASNYINFNSGSLNLTSGKAKYSFSTKSKDANITFSATYTLKDNLGKIFAQKTSQVSIKVRGDLFFSSLYNISNGKLESGDNSIQASKYNNLYIGEDKTIESLISSPNSLSSLSLSQQKIFISLSKKNKSGYNLPIKYPIKLTINNNQKVLFQKTFESLKDIVSLGNFSESGDLTIKITDADGYLIEKEISVIPSDVKTIDTILSTNLIEKGGIITTNSFVLYDEFKNLTSGNLLDVNLEISGNSVTFDDDKKTKTLKSYQGFTAFKLKSTFNPGISELKITYKNKDGKEIQTTSSIKVVDKIRFDINFDTTNLLVGSNKYNYTIKTLDNYGEYSLNSKAFLVSNDLYFSDLNGYVNIKDGQGNGSILTTTKAIKGLDLEFKIEGVKDSVFKKIDINPLQAIKIDLYLSKGKIESSFESISELFVQLKDKFGNLVFTDNSTQIYLEILDKYKPIISSKEKSSKVSFGKTSFILSATSNPGTAYFKVSTDPSLENNTFEIYGQSPFEKKDLIGGFADNNGLTSLGEKFFYEYDQDNYRFSYGDLEVLKSSVDYLALSASQKAILNTLFEKNFKKTFSGVGENAGKIETFYFWNKSKILNKKYNSIYTTLLGSSYGDITIRDNLANSLLFEPTSKALAVSSLLNNPRETQNIFSLKQDGTIALKTSGEDLSQDIKNYFEISQDGDLSINFYNETFEKLVSKIFLNIKTQDLNLNICDKNDISSCYLESKNSIILQSLDDSYSAIKDDFGISIIDSNSKQKILEVSNKGKIKSKNIDFSIKDTTKGLLLNLNINGNIIGNLAFNFEKGQINTTKNFDKIQEIKSNQQSGGFVVYIEDIQYSQKQAYFGNSTSQEKGIVVFYNNPYSGDNFSLNNFSSNFDFGYESFSSKGGIGWEQTNKTLLSFSAGKSVGEATKDYQTFSLINLGDPVLSLKTIKKTLPSSSMYRDFDSTVGKLVSNDSSNVANNTLDFNGDKNKDIIILKNDGNLELLEGDSSMNFISKGKIAYIPDLGSKTILETGDFFGDGFDDILVMGKDGNPIILSNDSKKITRIDLKGKLNLKGRIMNIKAFDMDNDNKADLITFDDNGDINIFYGLGKQNESMFLKKNVDSGFGLKLSNSQRTDDGAVFFDGIPQITKMDLNNSTQNLVNEDILNKLIFTQLTYNPNFSVSSTSSSSGEVINSIISSMPSNIYDEKMIEGLKQQSKTFSEVSKLMSSASGTLDDNPMDVSNEIAFVDKGVAQAKTGLNEFLRSDYFSNDNPLDLLYNGDQTQTTFLKSEYSQGQGLKIEKTYRNLNGNTTIKANDRVELNITLTNVTKNTLTNIAYADKIPVPFKFTPSGNATLTIGGNSFDSEKIVFKNSSNDEYNFLVDGYVYADKIQKLNLEPNQSLNLKIILDVLPFEYGFIDAGKFSKDAVFGEIIYKTKKQNCGSPYTIYKQKSYRSYSKSSEDEVCENFSTGSVSEKIKDSDNNGVADYIDGLIDAGNSQDTAKINQFSTTSLTDILKDTDKDGKPDNEDDSPEFSGVDDFMNSLDEVNKSVDKILSGVDEVVRGFSCGFGGGSCISAPLNWAPLAPGSDPTLFGIPAGDGLKVGEGIPVFSALTFVKAGGKCTVGVWPPGKYAPECLINGAGGALGTTSPTNFFRLFVTPTITGAVGTAVCFGAPAIVAGNANPKGVHPMVSGGNCIVAAKPIVGCKNDGSDGDISKTGAPVVSGSGFSIYNGDCEAQKQPTPYVGPQANNYINYKKTGTKDEATLNSMNDILTTVAKPGGKWKFPTDPLLSLQGGQGGMGSASVSYDLSAIKSGKFDDIIKVQMGRISPFPNFVMDWVTRQIEEIAMKLTDFPRLYIILPDFSSVMDSSWKNFNTDVKKAYNSGEEKAKKKDSEITTKTQNLEKEKSKVDCKNSDNELKCLNYDLQASKLKAQKVIGTNQTISGIKSVYEFLSTLPIITIKPEKVVLNVPWADKSTLDKAIFDAKKALNQYENEIKSAKQRWNIDNYTCVGNKSSSSECKMILGSENLLSSVRKNIQILEEYRKTPQKIQKMLNVKEVRLTQVLCNVETISKIMGGRIGDNGKRFKTWVELYILVKAILKSWQLMVDIFVDYDSQCHQCKNERWDLMYYAWKMIDMVIPKIPIVQFPKWPDIYLDLHNIRVNIEVAIPDFEVNFRPILIPQLPKLVLPSGPNAGVNLPQIPILPNLEIPELPEMPTLPTVNLPDLPPPPKIPKIFAVIEGFLNILKLITKAMCILKTTPFVPEWRAGDQIAFITERGGYLDFDFLDISLPQFSYPFVDALKVYSLVNLEFNSEFLYESSRQAAMPINTFQNDLTNKINIIPSDTLDFNQYGIDDINVDIKNNGEVKSNLEGYNSIPKILLAGFLNLYAQIKDSSSSDLSNDEFKKIIGKELTKISGKDYKADKIIGNWNQALNYSFAKEDKIIKQFIENNDKKFNEVKSILNEQKNLNSDLSKNIENKFKTEKNINILVSKQTNNDLFSQYNSRLEKYNKNSIESIKNLSNPDKEVENIRKDSKEFVGYVKTSLQNYGDKLEKNKPNNLLATALTTQTNSGVIQNSQQSSEVQITSETKEKSSSCQLGNTYGYVYKGIYVSQNNGIKDVNYRLFDYIDELDGKQTLKKADFDNDSDDDLVYMVGNEIFVKENSKQKPSKKDFYNGDPIVLKDGKDFSFGNIYNYSVNNFSQTIDDNQNLNIEFSSFSKDINNFRIELFDVVDKFNDLSNGLLDSYIPKNAKKYVVDAFSNIDSITQTVENTQSSYFKTNKNLAYIDKVGNLDGVNMTTKELINLNDDLSKNSTVIINSKTKIYSGRDSVNVVYYLYSQKDNELKNKQLTIDKYSHITFNQDVVLVSLSSDAYVEGKSFINLYGNKILDYLKKPILPGTKIEYLENEKSIFSQIPYVTIKYYDETENRVDFRDTNFYQLYDLGNNYGPETQFLTRFPINNGFYYGKVRFFKQEEFSTYSNQILLSSQIQSDKKSPEIYDLSEIKVPVYQKKTIDLTNFIYEDSGIKTLKDIYIDFDLTIDSDNNGNNFDDRDFYLQKTSGNIQFRKQGNKIFMDINNFDYIVDKTVRIVLIDSNDNVGYKDLRFQIYSPTPKINNISNDNINGEIDEELSNQPINFYRVRGGNLSRLGEKLTDNKGNFELNLEKTGTGLQIVDNSSGSLNSKLFEVNQETGKIKFLSPQNLTTKVLPSNSELNDKSHPKIIISKSGKEIYYQYLVTPNVGKVNVVKDFTQINKTGIYYKNIDSGYNYFEMPMGITFNAGDLFVYLLNDASKNPIFTVFKDGRINVMNEMYYLEYSEFGDYIVLNLKKLGSQSIIGQVLVIPEKNYIIR